MIFDKSTYLKCHYTFDEEDENIAIFHDESGNLNHTNSVANVVFVEGRSGKRAIEFNGSSSVVESNYIIEEWKYDENRAISLWIKPYDNVTRGIVGTTYYTWLLRRLAGGSLTFTQWTSGGGHTNQMTINSTTLTPIDTWAHVVVSWEDNVLRMYINGVLDSEVSAVTTVANRTSTQRVKIGGQLYPWNGNQYFRGIIDDIRFYEEALSADEVQQLYQVGAFFNTNNEYYTGDFDEQKPSHWWSGKDTIHNNLWVDRVGSLNWVLVNGFVKNSNNIALNGTVGINATMSHVGVNFGTYWHCVIEYELITNETAPFIIDFGSVTSVPTNCSAIGLNGKTRGINSKVDGNNSKGPGDSPTELSPNIRSIVEFGVCPGLSPNTSRIYRVIDFGEIVYGSEFSETTTGGSRLWNSWGNNFYLASGVAGNHYGSNAKIYDVKIYENDEVRWQVTPNKITYSKEFKEVDGTTKMMSDGSLESTTFKEV